MKINWSNSTLARYTKVFCAGCLILFISACDDGNTASRRAQEEELNRIREEELNRIREEERAEEEAELCEEGFEEFCE